MTTRKVVVDIETTGLKVEEEHKIVEIAALALENRELSDEQFHRYLDPQRASDPGALEVHGLTAQFLEGKPLFTDIVNTFLDFIRGAELIIHNAPFDVGFIDEELRRAGSGYGCIKDHCKKITDTLKLARRLHPGQRNSLDALCKRYSIDNTHRTLHGALLDAELLARVYLRMTSGQSTLFDGLAFVQATSQTNATVSIQKLTLPVITASADEQSAHEALLAAITQTAGYCLWGDST